MPHVHIDIADRTDRLTLKTMLEAERIETGPEPGDVVITDDADRAVRYAMIKPTLLVTTATRIPEAVVAMHKGVYGYIFLPFQPGEAGLMVRKALAKSPAEDPTAQPLGRIIEAESRLIQETLRLCRNNQTQAAKLLGIGRNTLWRKLKKIRDLTFQTPENPRK